MSNGLRGSFLPIYGENLFPFALQNVYVDQYGLIVLCG